jgi:hypothetical protein
MLSQSIVAGGKESRPACFATTLGSGLARGRVTR